MCSIVVDDLTHHLVKKPMCISLAFLSGAIWRDFLAAFDNIRRVVFDV